MRVPGAPHPKPWLICLSGLTQNDGDFSLWKGQHALNSRPAFLSGTRAPMTSTISDRTTRSSTNESGIRPAMDRLRSAAEIGFDLDAHRGHVRVVLSLALDDA